MQGVQLVLTVVHKLLSRAISTAEYKEAILCIPLVTLKKQARGKINKDLIELGRSAQVGVSCPKKDED
jgi:hypothetical protein